MVIFLILDKIWLKDYIGKIQDNQMNQMNYYDITNVDTKYKLYKKEREAKIQDRYQINLNLYVKDKFYIKKKIPKYEHLSTM